jgi:hypothetical protein
MSITQKLSRLACVIGATTVLSASLVSGNAMAAEKIRWQVPLAFPSHLIGLTTPVKHLSESLKPFQGAISSCATTSPANWCRRSRSWMR